MAYTNLKTDYQNRTAASGWRFCIEYRMKFAAQCPYWLAHRDIKNRSIGELLFEKWNRRPQRAYKLYWRTHPGEYEAANNLFKQRRNK